MNAPIDLFRGEYRFLSNFYHASFAWRGFWWASAEHAYQAWKADTRKDLDWVRRAPNASEAKKRGRQLSPIKTDWEDIKLDVMKSIIAAKFSKDSEMARLLLLTGNRELIEGNHWGDTFWGVCRGEGENHLGKILMNRRTRLRMLA